MDLYFLRHGLAGKANEWQGDDWDRPLTEEGKARMARETVTMARLGLVPEVIVTSPLLRALETAGITAQGLPGRPEVVIDKQLVPGFGVKQLAKILARHVGRQSVMLVGHEPDFSRTIGALIGGGRVVCKKGGLIWLDLRDPTVMAGELVAVIPPRMLAMDDADQEDGPEM
jgi:phosphohistidine phosphatase